jgi:mono/diheme cytochrome c family protein
MQPTQPYRRNRRCLFALTLMALVMSALILPARADDAAGAATFKAKCAMCHGADAAGKTPMGVKFNIPNLAAPEIQKKSDAELVEAISKGKNKMPGFASKLTAAQITQLKDYIREVGKKH